MCGEETPPRETGMSERVLSWKLWRIAGTHLISPWACRRLPTMNVVLPADGVMNAHCAFSDHVPPQEGCGCGLYSIPDATTMLRYKILSGAATPYRYALT